MLFSIFIYIYSLLFSLAYNTNLCLLLVLTYRPPVSCLFMFSTENYFCSLKAVFHWEYFCLRMKKKKNEKKLAESKNFFLKPRALKSVKSNWPIRLKKRRIFKSKYLKEKTPSRKRP